MFFKNKHTCLQLRTFLFFLIKRRASNSRWMFLKLLAWRYHNLFWIISLLIKDSIGIKWTLDYPHKNTSVNFTGKEPEAPLGAVPTVTPKVYGRGISFWGHNDFKPHSLSTGWHFPFPVSCQKLTNQLYRAECLDMMLHTIHVARESNTNWKTRMPVFSWWLYLIM